jgi:DNA-binding NarL/FixJ family response regulator
MTRLLLIDDDAAIVELFAIELRRQLGTDVVTMDSHVGLAAALDPASPTIALALIDVSVPASALGGLEGLNILRLQSPNTRLVLMVKSRPGDEDILHDAWELFPIAAVVSKHSSISHQLSSIRQVIETGTAPSDPPILASLLRSGSSDGRSIGDFSLLVGHAGHAKLWRALFAGPDPTYRSLADSTGLKSNTIKNYRAQLLPELERHGLREPSMREIAAFAQRCRPLIVPHVQRALGNTTEQRR